MNLRISTVTVVECAPDRQTATTPSGSMASRFGPSAMRCRPSLNVRERVLDRRLNASLGVRGPRAAGGHCVCFLTDENISQTQLA
jgi:hypothetical protein